MIESENQMTEKKGKHKSIIDNKIEAPAIIDPSQYTPLTECKKISYPMMREFNATPRDQIEEITEPTDNKTPRHDHESSGQSEAIMILQKVKMDTNTSAKSNFNSDSTPSIIRNKTRVSDEKYGTVLS